MKPTKPHIRLNPMFGFWICSKDYETLRGPRRVQGIGNSARDAFLSFQGIVDWERSVGWLS